jgi:hypothetical protein
MDNDTARLLQAMRPVPIEEALTIAADGLEVMARGKALAMAREAGLTPHEQAVYGAGVQAAADELRLTVAEILAVKALPPS